MYIHLWDCRLDCTYTYGTAGLLVHTLMGLQACLYIHLWDCRLACTYTYGTAGMLVHTLVEGRLACEFYHFKPFFTCLLWIKKCVDYETHLFRNFAIDPHADHLTVGTKTSNSTCPVY